MNQTDSADADRVTFSLPPELQKPGVISLADPAINASYASTRSSAGCKEGSGSFEDGTIEILSIDEGELVFKVFGSGGYIQEIGYLVVDGLYAASICPST